jgi:hypothetical protein
VSDPAQARDLTLTLEYRGGVVGLNPTRVVVGS